MRDVEPEVVARPSAVLRHKIGWSKHIDRPGRGKKEQGSKRREKKKKYNGKANETKSRCMGGLGGSERDIDTSAKKKTGSFQPQQQQCTN